jgi:hypothetical protein
MSDDAFNPKTAPPKTPARPLRYRRNFPPGASGRCFGKFSAGLFGFSGGTRRRTRARYGCLRRPQRMRVGVVMSSIISTGGRFSLTDVRSVNAFRLPGRRRRSWWRCTSALVIFWSSAYMFSSMSRTANRGVMFHNKRFSTGVRAKKLTIGSFFSSKPGALSRMSLRRRSGCSVA